MEGSEIEHQDSPQGTLGTEPVTASAWAGPDFPAYLRRQGFSAGTVKAYVYWVRRAELDGMNLKTISAEGVIEWAEARVPFSHASRVAARTALKHYWAMIGRKAPPPPAIIRAPRSKPGVSKALEDHQAAILLAAAEQDAGCRGLACLLAILACLRRSEIAALPLEAFREPGWIRLVGKGAQEARLPVHPVLQAALTRYLANRAGQASPWLFPSPRGGHISDEAIYAWVRDLSAEAGLGPIGVHRLRHTGLTIANDNTRDLRAVQMLARHASPTTTASYTRVSERRLEEAAFSITFSGGEGAPAIRTDQHALPAAPVRRSIDELSPAAEVHAQHISVTRHVPAVAERYSQRVRLAESRLVRRLAEAGLLEEFTELRQLLSEARHWYDVYRYSFECGVGAAMQAGGPVDYDEIAKEASERIKARALRAERSGEDLDNLCPECDGLSRHGPVLSSPPHPQPQGREEEEGGVEDQAIEEFQTFLDQVSPEDFQDGQA